jgi:hypothetical protein
MKWRSPEPKADPRRARQLRRPCCVETVSVAAGMDGVFGDGTAGSWCDVNQGSRSGNNDRVHDLAPAGSEEPYPEGDRALVVAKKRGNARGAKGGREVERKRAEEEVKDWRSAERLCALEAEKPPIPKEQLAASEPQGVTRRPSCSGVSPFGGLQPRSWKAGCGKSACPVWEGGWRIIPLPLPHVRLKAHTNRRVKVPFGQSTGCP